MPLRLRHTSSAPASTAKSLSIEVAVTALTMRNAPRIRRSSTSGMLAFRLLLVDVAYRHDRPGCLAVGLQPHRARGISDAQPILRSQRIPYPHNVLNAQV